MDREDRTAEASASSGSCEFTSWLSDLAQKGGKNGVHTKRIPGVCFQLRAATLTLAWPAVPAGCSAAATASHAFTEPGDVLTLGCMD